MANKGFQKYPLVCVLLFYLRTYFISTLLWLKLNAAVWCTDAPLMAFHDNVIKNLEFNKRPALITHTNDISIHFQTAKDRAVIFATSSVANNDYIKAYIEDGDVHVDTFIERAGGQVRTSIAENHRVFKEALTRWFWVVLGFGVKPGFLRRPNLIGFWVFMDF